jgi:GNAT superfamily N-acetyltransferase
MNVNIRTLNERDPEVISNSFRYQGWVKPVELYQRYLTEQKKGERVSLVAEVNGIFAGYVNIIWSSYYPSFRENNIPEINDFNVLIKYRRLGVGSKLMDKAEEIVKERFDTVGIGVGIFSDYGIAQTLYVKRGYVPDGKGISKDQEYVKQGQNIVIDDDVALYLTKKLS